MKKVKEIFYLNNREERVSDFSTGFLYTLEDGSRVETMTTDTIAEKYTSPVDNVHNITHRIHNNVCLQCG